MAKRLTSLPVKSKRETTADDVLLLSNGSTGRSFQLPITDVFPKLNNGTLAHNNGANSTSLVNIGNSSKLFVGGGSADTTTGIDNNTLIFKALRVDYDGNTSMPSAGEHNSAVCPIQIIEETDANDTTKGNILLAWDPSNYDLSNFRNTTNEYLTTVTLQSDVSGTLLETNGGTGLSSITKGGVLYGFNSNDIQQVTPTANGQVLIHNETTARPEWSTLTAGTNVSISNTAGAIEISSSIGSITANVDFDDNNLGMGSGWISNDVTNEGINIDTSGKVFIGSATPTAYFTSDLNVANNISLGTTGSNSQTLSVKNTITGATSNFTIQGASASGTGNTGGDVTIKAGDGDTNGGGGTLTINGGRKAGSGTDGSVKLRTADTDALTVDESQNVTVNNGNLTVTSGNATLTSGDLTVTDGDITLTAADHGIIHTGMGAVTQGTTAGFVDGVTLNTTSGKITLCSTCTLAGDATASFDVSNSLVTANSLILLTLFDKTGAANSRYSVSLGNQGTGTFTILLHNQENSTTTAGVMRVNFLVIN